MPEVMPEVILEGGGGGGGALNSGQPPRACHPTPGREKVGKMVEESYQPRELEIQQV
jgi:hypothetical protein